MKDTGPTPPALLPAKFPGLCWTCGAARALRGCALAACRQHVRTQWGRPPRPHSSPVTLPAHWMRDAFQQRHKVQPGSGRWVYRLVEASRQHRRNP